MELLCCPKMQCFQLFTCNIKEILFETVFRLIKAMTYPYGGIQIPGPLISVLVHKVKLTSCKKQINKRCAIIYLVVVTKGQEKRIYVCYSSSHRMANLWMTYFLSVTHCKGYWIFSHYNTGTYVFISSLSFSCPQSGHKSKIFHIKVQYPIMS